MASNSDLLKYKNYSDIEFIGNGAYGNVYKCKNTQNELVAVKVIEVNDHNDINDGLNEAIRLIKLNHENIIKVYNVYLLSLNKFAIEMEYLNYGNLGNMILKNKIKLNENIIIKILTQCCNALQYLENNGIIHRDIKLDNILIKHFNEQKEEIEIVFIDFGFIKSINSIPSISLKGTVGYLAPELLEDNNNYYFDNTFQLQYSFKSDIFAVGVIIYRLMSFDFKTDIGQLHHILDNDELVKNKLINNIKNNYNYSDNLINLIIKLLERDINNRFNAKQILNEMNVLFKSKSFSNEFIYCKTIGNGEGSNNGQFKRPFDIKIDEKDKLIFVVDCCNHRIQVFNFNGIFQYEIKTPNYPNFIAIDYFRNGKEILVGCFVDHKIYRFEKKENGKQLNEIIGTGKGSGDNEFDFISGGIIIDENTGNIYISDSGNHRIKVYSNLGQLLKIIKNNELKYPQKLDFNSKGQLVVASSGNDSILIFDLEGKLISTIKHENYIKQPFALVVDKTNDNIIISNFDDNEIIEDLANNFISVIDKNGQFIKKFGKLGKGIDKFEGILAFALDSNNGQLYVVDLLNHRIQIFK